MKKLLFLFALLAATLTSAQMNSYQTATLSAACTNANTTCAGVANSQLNVSTVGFNVASVTVHGTYTGLTLNFDISDDGGTTWYADTCTRGDTPTQESSEVVTNSATRQWDCGVSGTSNFRVRNNAISTGADIIGITLSVSNIEPAPTVSLSGSVTTTLGAGSSIIGKVGIDQTTPGTTNAVQETNLPATVDTNSGVKSASTLRVVLATDQPQLTNKILVTPDSVALPANQSVNAAQVGGTATDTNSGVKSNGTLRVVLATDQPALTNKLLVTPDSVALPANQSVNVAQMNGVTTSMNAGTSDTGTQRVVQAQTTPADATSNTSVPGPQSYMMSFNGSTWDRLKGITGQTGLIGVGVINSGTTLSDGMSSGIPSATLDNTGSARLIGSGGMLFNNSTYDRPRSGATANLPNLIGSTLTAAVTVDPCQSSAVAKSSAVINISSATTTSLVAASGSTVIYVCGFSMSMVGAIESLKFVYGTQVTNPCDTGQTALTGAFADGTASDIAWSYGPGSTIFKTIASQQLCAVTTGTVSIQGLVTFVQQ